jgi:hypothetical protein
MKESRIVGIHGVPRSGTSWLGQLINASAKVNFKFQPLFSYAFKDYLNETSSKEKILKFFDEISISDDDFINLRDKDLLGEYPNFKKDPNPTHLVFKQVRYHFLIEHLLKTLPQIKFVLIIRHPLEVLNSWRKAPREFDPQWDFEKEWIKAELKNFDRKEEYFGYQKWKEASELFLRLKEQYASNVILVPYNDLNKDPYIELQKIYKFIGLEMEEQVFEFVRESRSKAKQHTNSVFKSSQNSKELYQKEVPKKIQEFVAKDLEESPLMKFF